jgi:hypothetical protein
MAWMFVTGECICCHQIFNFNADHVPSVVVNGNREPVCRTCIERANPERVRRGLPAITTPMIHRRSHKEA